MKKYAVLGSIMLLLLTIVVIASVRNFRGFLQGENEIPIVYTDASGTFSARVSQDGSQIQYELTYSDMEADVTQAHIHVGKRTENGGISVWLCSNLTGPPPGNGTPPGTQTCPVRSGTISGIITAQNVVGPNAQGVAPGEFAELLRAIRDGNTYVNVHSARSPGGEIRSQIGRSNRRGEREGHDDH